LPGLADLGNHVKVKIGGQDFVLIAGRLGKNLAARIAEIAGAVKFADVPRRFGADTIDGGNEVAVGSGVCGLLELPKILAEPGDRGGGIENDLGAVKAKGAGAFGEVAVVADVNADFGEAEIEDGGAEVAGTEIKFFPEAGSDMRDMRLAIFSEIRAVVLNDRGGVVIDAFGFNFIERDNQGYAEFGG